MYLLKKLRYTQLYTFEYMPLHEQTKIDDCLSNLDNDVDTKTVTKQLPCYKINNTAFFYVHKVRHNGRSGRLRLCFHVCNLRLV